MSDTPLPMWLVIPVSILLAVADKTLAERALPMWLVIPVGILLTIGILALPLIVAFLPGVDKEEPPKQS